MDWFVNFTASHSSQIRWVAFVLTLIVVALAVRERWQKFKKADSKVAKCLLGVQIFVLSWCVPLVGLIAFKASEWSSNHAREFLGLVQLARSDNRPAFDQLKKIARNSNDPNGIVARQTVDSITRKHIGGAEPILQGMFVGGEDGHHSDHYLQVLEQQYEFLRTSPSERNYPMKDVRHAMQSLDNSDLQNSGTRTYDAAPRMALVRHVWNLNKQPIEKRTALLIKIIEADENLSVVEFATKRIAAHWKLNFGLLETEKFVKWWNENKDKLPDN